MRKSEYMSQAETQATAYRFGEFRIDAQNRQLWRGESLVPLNSKYFDVLLLLVSQSGQLVEKQRVFDEVWNGVFVTDAALTQCIKDIRRQLGDDASNPRYIKTVPKHGYIFIGHAVECAAETITAAQASPQAAATPLSRPYKFLDYFTEQDAQMFFGREPEVETISSQIIAHRTFILHGRSGVGKSSILRAGLMPRFKAESHLVFVIRSFTDPLHQMAGALLGVAGVEVSPERKPGLEELIRRAGKASPGRSVIFFLDQFEEFFTLLPEEIRQRFIETVRNLIADETLPLRLVFALREDLLAEMSQLKQAVPEIFHHEYRLKRLSREQAARAITEPARASGCHYEPELTSRILDDLGDQEGVDPPQLQIVCDSLYDSRDSTGSLTVAVYESLGTASQILANYLERVLRRFNAADLHIAKEILTALISIDGERSVVREIELIARIKSRLNNESSRINILIEELVAARVVRRRSQDGESWLELAHDFLTPEVSKWLSADELRLKRARGIIERAMENFRAHQLVIDADALDLLLPFGEQLGLTGEEADLLTTSILNRARSVPDWLIHASPSSTSLIASEIKNPDSQVRLRAIEACLLLRDPEMKGLLKNSALWDEDLSVRKAASIALADWLGSGAEEILSAISNGKKAGLIRRAVSLAMVRDYDKRMVRFSHLSIPVAWLVFWGLIWVRLRRSGREIIRKGIGGTVGGAASGLIGGLLLGASLAAALHAPAIEATSLILVLVSLGTFIGGVGGLGVSLGMVAASHVTYRHSRWWSVVGAAVGGAVIGGSSKLLGVDTLKTLFGQSPTGLTGALEGAIIGAGVSLGAILTTQSIKRARPWQKVIGASIGAMCAGILLTVIGGNLFSGSLEKVAGLFANSQIRMDPLAPYFGEVQFGKTTQIVLGAIEGLLFGVGMTAGIEAVARPRNDQSSESRL